ncbi:hypothetical protein [Azospirillum picis]|uniref:Uncharacterized protein n=1 Tax=Azospirillum picis TaxID=488438 RepID=A0ABU0MPI3_9PROT|nr:hypothetical protein [Azospirillum picis]MBP2301282.1 hypothetical protein [Azospirillum picis]MDQ0535113.1 hypothetical protein [Azospirillum picis]
MSSKKVKASLVVEIVQATGLRLTDEGAVKLEKLLGEIGACVIRQYPAPVAGNGPAIFDRVEVGFAALIGQLERASSGAPARKEIVEAAACLLAWVCALDLQPADQQRPENALPALTATSATEGMA